MRARAPTVCARRNVKSFAGCGGRIGGCAKNATCWQQPRPGSRGRPDPGGLPVHERESGPFPYRHDGPRARCFPGPRTPRRDRQARPAPDRVERRFEAEAPNRLGVADITDVPTLAGFLYLAIVLDVCSRRVVDWAMAPPLRTALVLEALEMAVAQRRPTAVIHHSDQGCQYTSLAFGARCRQWGVAPSMGSVGDCYDCEHDRAAAGRGLTPVMTDLVSLR